MNEAMTSRKVAMSLRTAVMSVMVFLFFLRFIKTVSMKYIFIENCKLTEGILNFFAESVGDNRNFTTFAVSYNSKHTFLFAATSNRGTLTIEI